MRARVVATCLLFSSLAVVWPAAPADGNHCYWEKVQKFVFGNLVVAREQVCPPHSEGGSDGTTSPINDVGNLACNGFAGSLQVAAEEFCRALPETAPAVTGPLIAQALRRIPIPPAVLKVQPPNGRTLVNFATNFYTDREEFTRTVNLLGQRVELRITPARFTWKFDDGNAITTTKPGAPYPRLQVTHDYLEKGEVRPRVDTTYTADFRVNGGAWQPVPGSVTIPGESVDLEIVEASPTLVGYN
jgi:hypothetical protein